MFEVMNESTGNILGIRATGAISKGDYVELGQLCERLINREGEIHLLVDMTDFKSEPPSAWHADFHFGREFRHKIEKMAVLGDKRWESWLTDFCRHFYALEAKYFHTNDVEAAWDWLTEEEKQVA